MKEREMKIVTFGACGTDNLDVEERQSFFRTLLQQILAMREKKHV